MTITRVLLVDDQLGELALLDRAAFRLDLILTGLDIPSPAVRDVTAARTDADGEDDTTTHHGARAVSATLALRDTPAALVDQINAYLHPARRPYLVVLDTEWGAERRLRLRADQWSGGIDHLSHRMRDHQLQWRAPDGIWEAVDTVDLAVAADLGARAGRTYPAAWPRDYAATSPSGRLQVVNPGNTWADQIVQLYGPCAGPRWTNDTTGEVIAFTDDLVIPAGEFVEVNTATRTANYLGNADASRLDSFDFEYSTWWQVPPGTSQVRYHPVAGVETGAAAALSFRAAWL